MVVIFLLEDDIGFNEVVNQAAAMQVRGRPYYGCGDRAKMMKGVWGKMCKATEEDD